MSESGRILSTSQVAQRCGVSAKTVARWVDAGVLKAFFTTGGHRRIQEDDVERFLESRRSLMAIDRADPGLRIAVIGADDATARFVATVAEGFDPNSQVRASHTELQAGLDVGDLRPHLIVVDGSRDAVAAAQMCATFREAGPSQQAFIVAIGPRFGGGFEAAHKVVASPLISEVIRDLLFDAQAHRD